MQMSFSISKGSERLTFESKRVYWLGGIDLSPTATAIVMPWHMYGDPTLQKIKDIRSTTDIILRLSDWLSFPIHDMKYKQQSQFSPNDIEWKLRETRDIEENHWKQISNE